MDPARWDRLQRLFHEAVDRSPEERAAFLESIPDRELRDDVRALLEADADPATLDPLTHQGLGRLLREGSGAVVGAQSLEGRRIGPYRVVRRIGQGGMGAVYLAEREDVSKQVALKLVRGALGAPELVQRFLLERRVLARLDHPHIARLLDAGVTEDETPWFAMEHVEGEPITAYCEGRSLPPGPRLRLFRDVCDAVSYAHASLVVHRDIKPSNVLVTADGQVKLLDFGIAKLLGADDDETLTRTGVRVMSPAYAAPEQQAGAPVTTATDVYALGVLLYELLVGARPGEAPAPTGDAAGDAAGDGPSRRVGDRRPSSLTGDLEAICRKAMDPDPRRRYRSAEQLRDDVTRHLTGLPVEARLPTFRYRAGKFLRRHATAVAGATVVALSLGGGLGAAVWQGQRAERSRVEAESARDDAQTALARSRTVTEFLISLFQAADPGRSGGETVTAEDLVERGIERIGELDDDPELQALLLETLAHVDRALARYDDASLLARRALSIRRSLPADSSLVTALNIVGMTYSERGFRDSAAAAYEEALPLSRRVLGEEHDETLALMNNLAIAYSRLGRNREAEAMLRRQIDIERRTRPDDLVRMYALSNLGVQLTHDGRYAEAEALLRESLEIRRAASDPNELRLAWAVDNLGMMLREAGHYDEAEPLLREGFELRRRVLGEDHRYFGESLFSLGTLLALRAGPGDLEEADTLLHRALEVYRASVGPGHPGTAYIFHSLGILETQRGDLAEAERRYRQALEIRRGSTADNPLVTVKTLDALAGVLRSRGASEEALAIAREGVGLAESTLPEGHPERSGAGAGLGLALAAAGEPGPGRARFARDIASLAGLVGADYPRVRAACRDARALGIAEGVAACGA